MVAFVGRPHRINDRGSQVLKALSKIGFEDYYLAEQVGWVLYLEGSTDLDILRTFATTAGHPAADRLAEPFVIYVGDQPQKARDHFHGLREGKPDLAGFALFDRLSREDLPSDGPLHQVMWRRREIENYLCARDVLLAWAREGSGLPIAAAEWEQAMDESIAEIEGALATLGTGSPWSKDTKVSGEFLTPLFRAFYKRLRLPNLMSKSNFHQLARFVPAAALDPEVIEVLDAIERVAASAQGAGLPE